MKKEKKILMLIIIGLIMCVLSWIVSNGAFSAGVFTKSEVSRMGIFDYFLVVYYSFYYKSTDIFYLLLIGGLYGVLSKTASYRKLVTKCAKLIKGKEMIAMAVITLLSGLWIAFATQILPVLIFVPFIITVFLKVGKDKITAASAALGGIFIGLSCTILGTYGLTELSNATYVGINDGIKLKVVLFISTYILYNLFTILYMKKNSKLVNDTKSDPFTTLKLDEKGVSKKKKVWPIVTIFAITLLLAVLAYIDWNKEFNVTVFEKFYEKISGGVFKDILGSVSAFGYWTDVLPISFGLFIAVVLIAIIDKISFDDFVNNFIEGVKKVAKPVLVYVFATTLFITTYFFGFPITFINTLLGSGDFNVITIVLVGIVGAFFYVDPEFMCYTVGSHLAVIHADNIIKSTILLRVGYGLAAAIVPSSCILMFILEYLDIPYTKWIKHIWKFVLSSAVLAMIIATIL